MGVDAFWRKYHDGITDIVNVVSHWLIIGLRSCLVKDIVVT